MRYNESQETWDTINPKKHEIQLIPRNMRYTINPKKH